VRSPTLGVSSLAQRVAIFEAEGCGIQLRLRRGTELRAADDRHRRKELLATSAIDTARRHDELSESLRASAYSPLAVPASTGRPHGACHRLLREEHRGSREAPRLGIVAMKPYVPAVAGEWVL